MYKTIFFIILIKHFLTFCVMESTSESSSVAIKINIPYTTNCNNDLCPPKPVKNTPSVFSISSLVRPDTPTPVERGQLYTNLGYFHLI